MSWFQPEVLRCDHLRERGREGDTYGVVRHLHIWILFFLLLIFEFRVILITLNNSEWTVRFNVGQKVQVVKNKSKICLFQQWFIHFPVNCPVKCLMQLPQDNIYSCSLSHVAEHWRPFQYWLHSTLYWLYIITGGMSFPLTLLRPQVRSLL